MAKTTRKLKSVVGKNEAAKPAITLNATSNKSLLAAATETQSGQIGLVPASRAARKNHILLEFLQPGAKSVYVAGSFNEWKPESTPLIQTTNGHWVGDLAVKPGRHEYLFVVDGQWLPDPNAKESVQNPFGGKNSVLVVSE